MRSTTLSTLLALPFFTLACGGTSSSSAREPLDIDSGVPDSALPDSGPPDSGACVRGQVWKATSAAIELSSFGFFDGSTGYGKAREELAAAQLTALDGLCLRPAPTQEGFDYTSYRITITDRDGSATTYRAAQDNVRDSDEGASDIPTIDIDSLAPFLKTFRCLTAGETRHPVGAADAADAGDAGAPWSTAPEVTTDAACRNGVYVGGPCSSVWMRLKVATAGPYRVSVDRCFGSTRLHVLSTDGSELATSDTAVSPACPSLNVTFPAAGDYPLAVETPAKDCSVRGPAGDMRLRITPVTSSLQGK